MQVDHWGLHWEGPYPFLVEPQGSRCLLKGHEDWTGSFEGPKAPCPHKLLHLRGDVEPPPATPFLPIPDKGAYSYTQDWRRLTNNVEAWWAHKPAQLARQLTTTNLTPLCIIGYRWSNLDAMLRLIELPRLRPLIFLGQFVVPTTIQLPEQKPFNPEAGLAALREFVNGSTSRSD